MLPDQTTEGIQTVICNDRRWYLRLGRKLGLYREDLTHSTIKDQVMAVPRAELDYWRDRVEELKAGTLEHGPARGMLLHESIHCRQMRGRNFWLWSLHYLLSKRYRRRMEEEAYTIHLTYLAQQGIPIEAPHWIGHFQDLYFGAFNERRAREAFDRIAAAIREKVPNARIPETVEHPDGVPSYAPWMDEGESQSSDGVRNRSGS